MKWSWREVDCREVQLKRVGVPSGNCQLIGMPVQTSSLSTRRPTKCLEIQLPEPSPRNVNVFMGWRPGFLKPSELGLSHGINTIHDAKNEDLGVIPSKEKLRIDFTIKTAPGCGVTGCDALATSDFTRQTKPILRRTPLFHY